MDLKAPRMVRWLVREEKKLSTAFSQEPEVGVKWITHRGWRASQARTFWARRSRPAAQTSLRDRSATILPLERPSYAELHQHLAT
jgi:hypothetical protein